jgi:hypothetical protein
VPLSPAAAKRIAQLERLKRLADDLWRTTGSPVSRVAGECILREIDAVYRAEKVPERRRPTSASSSAQRRR